MTVTRIRVDGLSKRYYIGDRDEYRPATLYEHLKDTLVQPAKKAIGLLQGHSYAAMGLNEELWSLKNVAFSVQEGEIVGIIGRNGAGKSTLLKVLSRITPPTRGQARIRGTLSSLLEVGTGFHGNLTGRENVYLNGAILGMTKTEIDRKFDEIVDFSGVEKFIDTPVRFYSSGMTVRLAFSVAAHLEPDILIIDEVLAVGDIGFHRKSMERMKEITRSGRTILFVSHQIGQIAGLCSRVMLMEQGEIIADGAPAEVTAKYFNLMESENVNALIDRKDRIGSGEAHFSDIWVEDQNGNRVETILSGTAITFFARIKVCDQTADLSNLAVAFSMETELGQNLGILSMHPKALSVDLRGKDEVVIGCRLDRFPVNDGTVRIGCSLHHISSGFAVVDSLMNAHKLNAVPGDFYSTGIPLGIASKLAFDCEWIY